MEIKLGVIDEAKVEYFLTSYSSIRSDLMKIEQDINMLTDIQAGLEQKLKDLHLEEAELMKDLEAKHGPGEINVENLTYVKNES